ncbi:MAG: hypothetical protein AAF939_18380 [Planctomycetota bacterium]
MMWRAFFFAVGAFLILLGGQCLVVDQFHVTEDSKLSRVAYNLASIVDTSSPSTAATEPVASRPQARNDSGFGPSRFQNSPFGSSGFYGGTTSGNGRASSDFQLSSFGDLNPADSSALGQPQKPAKKVRVIQTTEWMPWSLLAAGMLVALYTNLSQGRISSE